MAWDDTDNDDDEDFEEEEEWLSDDGENGPAITRNPYSGGYKDPFDMPEIGENYMQLDDFLKSGYSSSCSETPITQYILDKQGNLNEIKEKIKKMDHKKPFVFDPENILVDFGSSDDRKKKVRGVRGGNSPKTPNK